MPTTKWTGGAGDGNATTAGNWDNGVPTAGYDVVVNATSQNITTGLGSVALNSCTVGNNYTGNLVASLTTGTITTLNYYSGGQYGRFSGSVTIGTVAIPNGRQLYIDGGTWGGTRLLVSGGTIEAAAAAALANIFNGSANWTIYANATRITSFHNSSGRVVTDGRNIGQYVGGYGSSLELRSTSVLADGSGTGYAFNGRNSTITFAGTGGTSDTVRNEGVIDTRPAIAAQTITTLYEFPGSVVHELSPGLGLIVTNELPFGGTSTGGGLVQI